MEETIVRSPEAIREDWETASVVSMTVQRDEKDEDPISKEIKYLQVQASLQAVTDNLGLEPVGKTDIASAVVAMSRAQPLVPEQTQQDQIYGDLLDELIASGRAGKFAETLIGSVRAKEVRDRVAAMFIVKLIADKRFGRVRTAIAALDFSDQFARFVSAVQLASASGESTDVDLVRSLAAPIVSGTDIANKVCAYLSVYAFTRFEGDLQMARSAADAPKPIDRATGRICLAVAFASPEETEAAWRALAAAPKCEQQTKLFFSMLTATVCWSIGGLGLPKLPEDTIKRMLEGVPVKSWRDHVAEIIAQTRARLE